MTKAIRSTFARFNTPTQGGPGLPTRILGVASAAITSAYLFKMVASAPVLFV